MSDTATSVTFRTAQPAPAAEAASSAPSTPSEASTSRAGRLDTSDAPPSLYNEVNQKAYAIDHLKLGLYHKDKHFPEVAEQAKALDDYVLQQIKARGMKDEAGSYKEVIDALYKQIGKSPNEDPVQALKRLTTAAGAISRLESAKLQPILSAISLTPAEFEGIQP
jgi:hypothetical protein